MRRNHFREEAPSGRPVFAPAVAALVIALLTAACAPRVDIAPPPSTPHAPLAEPAAPACRTPDRTVQEGTASWYGAAHHGQRTASGETYDMNALTAAHRELPLGSRIKVTNRDNGRSVELTVNDRGPFAKDRILDVSSQAARELGFARSGLAPVRIERADAC